METNRVLILSAIFIILLIVLVLLTGGVREDVYIRNYTLSPNNHTLTITVDNSSKLRHIGKAKIKQDGNDLYLKFYTAYGFNANLGTKDTYELDVTNIDEIYFYIGKKGYKKVLELRNKVWNEPYNEITVNKKI